MNSRYWTQKATPWVSYSVLAGGMLTAVLLVFVYRTENDFQSWNPIVQAESMQIGN